MNISPLIKPIQPICDGLVMPLEQVPVHVEDNPDGLVAEPSSDALGVDALGYQPGDVRMPQVV